jgi:hypothetical protein
MKDFSSRVAIQGVSFATDYAGRMPGSSIRVGETHVAESPPRELQKKVYNFESLYKCIQGTYTAF